MALVAFSSLPLPLSLMAAPRKTASTWPIKAAPACICRASHGGTRSPARSALFRSFLLIIYAPNTHRFSFNYRPFTQTHLPQMRYFLAPFLLDDRWRLRKKNVFFSVPGSPCEHDGICVNTPGSFACNCTQGFTGPRCETNVNECESHPCQNDGSCLDDPGTFRCVCMPGK